MGTSELSLFPGRVPGHGLGALRPRVRDTRWLRRGLWPLGLLAGVLTLTPTLSEQALDRFDLSAGLRLLAGWSFIASGLIGWARRSDNRAGVLMVAIGFLYLAPAILLQSHGSLKITLGQLLAVAFMAAFVLLLVAFPSGRLESRLDRVLFASVFIPAVPMQLVWLAVLPLPGNALLVWPDAQVADAIDSAQRIIFLGAVAVLPAMLVRRWLRASPPLRRVLNPVLFGAAAVLLYGVYVLLDKLGGPAELVDDCFRLVFAGVPIMFLVGLLRARLARSAIGDLLVELREPAPPGALRDALARAVRDPSLAVAFWVPQYAAYVDDAGQPTELPPDGEGRVATLVERGGARVAALVHDASLRGEPELVGAVCAAAGIALENERLQADLRARLEELRGSRARILRAGDAERRRLERDLHDGAQQRLIALSLELRRVATRLAAESEEARILGAAREELLASLRELRELAHGIHPGVLSDHGLDVGLQGLAARCPVPVALSVEAGERLPAPIEVAAYYLVAESLTNVAKYARARTATVGLGRTRATLVVRVSDDGVGGADPDCGSGLRGLADRVEALGGHLAVSSPPGKGTTIRAELPCK